MAGLGSNTIPENGMAKEQHNSNKRQNNETERRPMTTKQTSRNGNQTLKLHHVRNPTLAKEEGKAGAAYNSHPHRKAVIYKEALTPWEVTQSVPILDRPALKQRALSQGKEDEKTRDLKLRRSHADQSKGDAQLRIRKSQELGY